MFHEILHLITFGALILQVEFVGDPMCWNTGIFSATAGGGAFCNGQKIHSIETNLVERFLLVTGFGYEHNDPWATNLDLYNMSLMSARV
nr:phosphatase impl1, chloroplastic [Quercus suber]